MKPEFHSHELIPNSSVRSPVLHRTQQNNNANTITTFHHLNARTYTCILYYKCSYIYTEISVCNVIESVFHIFLRLFLLPPLKRTHNAYTMPFRFLFLSYLLPRLHKGGKRVWIFGPSKREKQKNKDDDEWKIY